MIFDEVAHQVDRICKNPCHFLNLRTGARNWAPYPNNYIFVYFPYKVQITKESYLATGLSIIADIGGTASLLLGVSFFHIAKLAVTLFDLKIKESDHYLGPFHLQAQWPISCLLYIVMCTDPSDFWHFSFVFYSAMCTNWSKLSIFLLLILKCSKGQGENEWSRLETIRPLAPWSRNWISLVFENWKLFTPSVEWPCYAPFWKVKGAIIFDIDQNNLTRESSGVIVLWENVLHSHLRASNVCWH